MYDSDKYDSSQDVKIILVHSRESLTGVIFYLANPHPYNVLSIYFSSDVLLCKVEHYSVHLR